MEDRIRIRRDKPTNAMFEGLPDSEIVKRPPEIELQDIIVVKIAGHKYWAQLPPDSYRYAPMEYRVYRVNRIEECGLLVTYICEMVTSFEPRARK